MSSRRASGWWTAACTASPRHWPGWPPRAVPPCATAPGVERVLTAGGRVSGVRLEDGEVVAADTVVVNADAAAVAAALLGPDIARAVSKPAGARSLSAVTWAMRAEVEGWPLARHTVCFSDDYRAEFDAIARGTLTGEPTVYLCAQDRDDAGTAPGGPERLLVLVNAPATGDRHLFPSSEIAACADRTFTLLRRCGLHVRPTGEPVATTPAGFDRLFPGTGGGALRSGDARADGIVRAAGFGDGGAGALPGGGQRAPGGGGADGGVVRPAGGGTADGRPCFDAAVPHGGYTWWYVDALSDDGQHGLTIIAFIGSVFSPYYAWARRRDGLADPANHCSLNVALYGRPRRWAMTERGRGALVRDADQLAIGPSRLHWRGDHLEIEIAEVTAPLPSRIRGTVRVHPGALTGRCFTLDDAGHHHWSPIAPVQPGGGGTRPAGAPLVRPRLPRHQQRHPPAGGGFHALGLVPRADAGRRRDPLQRAPA